MKSMMRGFVRWCAHWKSHDNVLTWKRIPHYLPIVKGGVGWGGGRGWPLSMNSLHTGSGIQGANVFFVVSLNKLWNKHSSFQWLETPWRWCTVIVMRWGNSTEADEVNYVAYNVILMILYEKVICSTGFLFFWVIWTTCCKLMLPRNIISIVPRIR